MRFKIKGKPTIGKLIGPYEAAISDYKTWAYACDALEIMLAYFKDVRPDSITRQDARDFREYLQTRYARTTTTKICQCVSAFFTWLMHYSFILANPFIGIQKLPSNIQQVELEYDEVSPMV